MRGYRRESPTGPGPSASSGTKHSPAPSRARQEHIPRRGLQAFGDPPGLTRALPDQRSAPFAGASSRAAIRLTLQGRRAGRGRHVRVRAEVFWGQSLPLYTALHPFGTAVLIYAMLKSASVALANGGIEWRGTTPPLSLLRGGASSSGRAGDAWPVC